MKKTISYICIMILATLLTSFSYANRGVYPLVLGIERPAFFDICRFCIVLLLFSLIMLLKFYKNKSTSKYNFLFKKI